MAKRDVYMNQKQQVIYYCGARDTRLLAARRFGKTDGTIGPQCGRVVQSMPRGAGVWCGNSTKQLMTRTVPATLSAISRFWQLEEGRDFWWGQPPKKLNIPLPIIKPKDWSRCITFYNGFVWHLVSMEVRGSANSLTVNFIMVDEARFIKKSKLDTEVMPALSGITHPLGDPAFTDSNPFYKGTLFASDAALPIRDNWMEKEEEKLDLEIESGPYAGKRYRELQNELEKYAYRVIYFNNLLQEAKKAGKRVIPVHQAKKAEIEQIYQACKERKPPFDILPITGGVGETNVKKLVEHKLINVLDAELLLNYPFLITNEDYMELKMLRESPSLKKRIQQLRCNTFAFFRANSLDNIDLLGKSYIERQKRDLPPLVFAISILNCRKRHSSDGFYSRLDIENVHGYVPFDCPAVGDNMHLKIASGNIGGTRIDTDYLTPDFGELQKVKNCRLDGDVRDGLPLYIAFDYNANINWVVTGQVYHSERFGRDALFILSSMYVKNERKLRELVQDWCAYYAPHKKTCKDVTYFYDATAKHKGYAINGQQDFKDVVIEELNRAGWQVNAVDMGRPMNHELKHKDINEALAGITQPFIQINTENNEALIVAMENTGVLLGRDGFRKDKSKEKSVESEWSDPYELRTDGTDAADSLFIGVKYYLTNLMALSMPLFSR